MDYFDGEKAYLTQSGQLYNEATAAAFGKVYCFGPTFRAEKSKTRRHLTEFWMVEPEMAYATLDDVMTLSERMLSYIAARVLESACGRVKDTGTRHGQAGSDRAAVSAPALRRCRKDAAGRTRQAASWKRVLSGAETLARRTRRILSAKL